jgi:hypothetical protein
MEGQVVDFKHHDLTAHLTKASERIEGIQIRQLRNWVDRALRNQDCTAAHRLLSVLNTAVHEQAAEKGWADAENGKEPRPGTDRLWKSGYMTGYNQGKGTT